MIEYKEINWKTLEFFKTHLYRRLTAPLNETIDHLERLQVLADEGLKVSKLSDSRHQLEGLLNLINAWVGLISFKHNASLNAHQFRELSAEDIPGWFKAYFEENAPLRADFTHSIRVHQETFLEAVVLLYQVAKAIGDVIAVQIVNAPPDKPGVYVRVVFSPGAERALFSNLNEIEQRFDRNNLAEWDIYMQLAVACDMLAVNHARFTLQNNTKTNQQALAAYFIPHEMPSLKSAQAQQPVEAGAAAQLFEGPTVKVNTQPAAAASPPQVQPPAQPQPQTQGGKTADDLEEEIIRTGLLKLLSHISYSDSGGQRPTAPASPVKEIDPAPAASQDAAAVALVLPTNHTPPVPLAALNNYPEGQEKAAQVEGEHRAGEARTDDKNGENRVNPGEKQG